ncbi:MAG: ATP-binding protein [Microcystis wesenbergii Mw_QC_S_20081001_S30D]|jgi:SpoVK/Ycf46/Vps4 family AAA+-type ATPase|uniref:ATP-binding protein n=1 Tax=Microcystis wesenbergii Mw_QC_S_20081001_S30D TaxID=2486245 RepID=A0A552J8I8_9CHRO|nr:ATP-binding protein [Microcystis aeruginosa W11-03]NCR92429.1 ATP-binding protein [Microcystis aeruginosa W11-06]TRU92088.1 MAG: ATP-binding protein [Microcystis wesenbergii Mw_QC_S_20081001_S30D]TRV04137.1 MAG: ATP-binding protein [Microcystis wesenbergii Mw_QC_S_20081001_S30]TRV04879.1 MAG: ATP-binding protein [Microcystis wesenbergii Mw_QC_B_20070930_S4D]TRV17585.1 MAG: ATP-binding protein [Microcystis wesenbergii Mw_QC_B_20070930_S4]
MSTARHILALLKSHVEGEEQQFYSAALQMAAHEARQGHGKLAQEIRELIDQAKASKSVIEKKSDPIPLVQPKGDLANLVSVRYPDTRLSDMILTSDLEFRLKRVLTEQRQGKRLREHNLMPRRKLLLVGPPGSGKTMTAEALAGELKLPLFTTLYDSLMGKYMGETASRLKLIFEAMTITKGVYFFDEFDAIGTQRHNSNDVGEIRRILNSFLMFLEQEQGDSLILAATNHPQLLDKALFRRFDDVIEYQLPDAAIIRELIESRLISFEIDWKDWSNILNQANGLAQAEIVRATDDAAKQAVLSNSQKVSEDSLISAIMERKDLNFNE